jgi:sortase A
MNGTGATKQTGGGPTAQILIWGGLLLLLIGGLLTYPYIGSRLVTLPIAPTFAPSPTSLAFASPSSTPPLPPTNAPTPIPPQTPPAMPTSTHTPIPEPTPSPTPTSAPAYPARIVIPSVGVDAPVVPISWHTVTVNGQAQPVWDVPDSYAVGWHETSAPLGTYGNTVLNGHNTTNGEVFRDLYTMETGDTIVVHSEDTVFTYTVENVLILPEAGQPLEVRLENARYILPTDDERLTLVTCHPYGSLRNRLIVIAHPTVGDGEG